MGWRVLSRRVSPAERRSLQRWERVCVVERWVHGRLLVLLLLLLLLVLLVLLGREKAQVSITCGPWVRVILRDWPLVRMAWAPVRAGRVGMRGDGGFTGTIYFFSFTEEWVALV
jgi:hypothetical protein